MQIPGDYVMHLVSTLACRTPSLATASVDDWLAFSKKKLLLEILRHTESERYSLQTNLHYGFTLNMYNAILIKVQLDATVCSLIYFTAKSLYMFRVFTAPIIRSTNNCNRSLPSTSLQRGQVPTWPRWREVAVPIL